MKATGQKGRPVVNGIEISISGRFPRVAKLYGEYHEYVGGDMEAFLTGVRKNVKADIFTFVQPIEDRTPKYDFPRQPDPVAVLPIETYEKWWKQTINDKTRNMIRKAGKKGVTIQQVEFNDELVKGIKEVYDESPLRQGKPFKHYKKSFEVLKEAHASYLDRAFFVGAYFEGKLIGFMKVIVVGKSASIMQIISMVSHRDKAPTNALLGKVVEICAERGITNLQYGIWSRRSMGDFKLHHGFQEVELPRYFVPLNPRGSVALGLKLHRGLMDVLPGKFVDYFAGLRTKWYLHKYRSQLQS